jgi:hypothetical protein
MVFLQTRVARDLGEQTNEHHKLTGVNVGLGGAI